MRAGKLDQKITYQTIPTSKSDTGADIPGAAEDFVTVYAEISVHGEKGGAVRPEFDAAGRTNILTRYDLKHRYVSGILETMQVRWGSRTLQVIAVPDIGERRGYMIVLAEEQR